MGILGQQKDAEHKGLYIKFTKPKDADKYRPIFADKIRIQEVVDNLINNGVKYTQKGGITISISKDKESVEVTVSDTGVGMPKEAIKQLGKKFYRIAQHTSDKNGKNGATVVRPGGTGLGLYVTYGLVKAHGGTIVAKSEIGKGSEFTFKLPFMKPGQKYTPLEDQKDVFKKIGLSSQ